MAVLSMKQRSTQQRKAEAAVVKVLHALASDSDRRVVSSGAVKALHAAERAELLGTPFEYDLATAQARPPHFATDQDRICEALSKELGDPAFLLLASSSDDEDDMA